MLEISGLYPSWNQHMHVPILLINGETTHDSIQPAGRALLELRPKMAQLARTPLAKNILLFEKVEHSAVPVGTACCLGESECTFSGGLD